MSRSTVADKQRLRKSLLAARSAMPLEQRAGANAAIQRALRNELADKTRRPGSKFSTVAGYAPMASEPGGADLPELLAQLFDAVMLPVPVADDPPTLAWVQFASGDPLRRGALAPEPVGEHHGAHALAEVDLVIAPALAVDHRGIRLGRGGGYYDRALSATDAFVVALIYDDEFVPAVPSQSHDRAVSAIVTPSLGWRELSLAVW